LGKKEEEKRGRGGKLRLFRGPEEKRQVQVGKTAEKKGGVLLSLREFISRLIE